MQNDNFRCHIPGAVYLNLLSGDNTDMYPRNIPPKEQFENSAQEAGINADSHVIVYSSTDWCGYFLSGRGWWSFKVSIILGAIAKPPPDLAYHILTIRVSVTTNLKPT